MISAPGSVSSPVTMATPSPSHTAFHDHATERRRLRGPATVSRAVVATSRAGMVTVPSPPRYTENAACSGRMPKCVISQVATWAATTPSTAASTASAACRSSRRRSSSPSTAIGATSVMSAFEHGDRQEHQAPDQRGEALDVLGDARGGALGVHGEDAHHCDAERREDRARRGRPGGAPGWSGCRRRAPGPPVRVLATRADVDATGRT